MGLRGTETQTGVAGVEILRRVQWMAIALALLGALGFGLSRGWEAALSLTVAALVSIVSLRTLEAAVRRIQVDDDGGSSTGSTRFSLRWTLLLVILSTTLILGLRDALALLVGLSVLPVAAILEAGVQVCRSGARDGRDRTHGA